MMPLRKPHIWDVEYHSLVPREPGSLLLGVSQYHEEVGSAFTRPRADASQASLHCVNGRKEQHLLNRSHFHVLCRVRVKLPNPVRQPSVAPATPCSCWKERECFHAPSLQPLPPFKSQVSCLLSWFSFWKESNLELLPQDP